MVILEGIHLNSLLGNLLFFGRGIRNNSGRTLGTLYSFFFLFFLHTPFNPYTSALSETLTALTALHRAAPSETLTANKIIRSSPSILRVVKGIVTWLLASNQIQSSALPPGSGGLQQVWCSSNQIQSSMVNVVGQNSNLLEDLTSIIRSIRL
ncbi:hypothetical protein HanRHA438_Chr08g0335141 [Helianthus annuus]|uniref:Uncharacterized protein n=1 Tax=Helianthus annuus TaxID=4232 RepID=A0A251U2H3_HELAN|nr:hypothetical protein HanXRQr2_Chr08g0323981 [Helianthus annuus]KAJ0537793.1 hypothetical protein HanHA300_Chr08g0267771 [Helianthus annuus]KAJ0721309.1 hypothetical protein HanOQP8_Chr08g0274141 [Helianthus annuus]KAJ0896481.1 hypothetical protein HanRHA438_Chr08g0335141 [Helianthus annuus]